MARPIKRQGTETFEITVPKALFDSLVHLATHTNMGATENAVAVHLLSNEIDRLERAGDYGLKMFGKK